ncbi:MAG: hypothetical protein FWB99_01410 [Treponema sp.]|nr:hypothetical protein [Treponema sp.]
MKKTGCRTLMAFWACFLLAWCAAGSNSVYAAEVWRDVESIKQVLGRWEVYLVVDIPSNPDTMIPATTVEVTLSFEFAEESHLFITVDLEQFLADFAAPLMKGMQAEGITMDMLWEYMSADFAYMEGVVDVGRYYFVIVESWEMDIHGPPSPEDTGIMKINERGDKLRLTFQEPLNFNLGDPDLYEVVLFRN